MRSHIDTILFCKFLYVSKSDYENLGVVLTQDSSQDELYQAFVKINEQKRDFTQKSFHETYHFWQGLRLPYLYLNSFLDIRTIMKVFMDLSAIDQNHENWDISIPSLGVYTEKYHIFGELGSLYLNSQREDGFAISIIDLLETSTSIAEYQITTSPDKRANHLNYTRWYKRNPAYIKVYKYVNQLFSNEDLAIAFLIPLVNKAFETSQPIKAFIYLLNELFWWIRSDSNSRLFLDKNEPRNWKYLFEILSRKLPYDENMDSLTNMNIMFEGFYQLNMDKWLNSHYDIGTHKLFHPFIYKQAKKWEEKISEDEGFGNLLNFPGYVNNEVRDYTLENFRPNINFVKFHLSGGLSKVLTFGMMKESEFKYDWPIPIIDLLTMYSVIKKAANVQFHQEHRLCHHTNCKHYLNNYCNSYPTIPKLFKDCGFENRVKHLINWKNHEA